MSKLFISEYAAVPTIAQIAASPPVAVQVVDFSGGVTSSSAFNGQTRYVRLQNDAICSIRFDGSAATTSYPRSPADTIEYYGVNGGATLSVIANT